MIANTPYSVSLTWASGAVASTQNVDIDPGYMANGPYILTISNPTTGAALTAGIYVKETFSALDATSGTATTGTTTVYSQLLHPYVDTNVFTAVTVALAVPAGSSYSYEIPSLLNSEGLRIAVLTGDVANCRTNVYIKLRKL